jgi:hypothetical protein
MNDDRRSQFRRTIQPGLDAVRTLWLPFVLIQFFGLLLVLAYFYMPSVARVCDSVGELKVRSGLLFAAVTMPLACGVAPEFFKYAAGVDRSFSRLRLELMLHNMGLFLVGGICLDLFYSWLGRTFAGVEPAVAVAAKVAIDQALYTTLVGVPLIAASYTLRKVGYRPFAALRQLNADWYARDVMPVLVVCWAYWLPMTSLMYTLPPNLTFVYGLVASAASSVLLVAVAGRNEQKMADAHV